MSRWLQIKKAARRQLFKKQVIDLIENVPYTQLDLVAGSQTGTVLERTGQRNFVRGVQVRETEYRLACIRSGGFYTEEVERAGAVRNFQDTPVAVQQVGEIENVHGKPERIAFAVYIQVKILGEVQVSLTVPGVYQSVPFGIAASP